jgi:hypothetical protein
MAHPLTHIAAPRDGGATLAMARRGHLLVGAATALLLVCAGAARGSYFPGSWGWLVVACAWAALLALVLQAEVEVGRVATWTLAAWAAVTGWTLLSVAWSADVTQTVLEAQRTLVYLAAFGAAMLLARRAPGALAAGAVVSTTALCAYALATRLVPDRFGVIDSIGGYRLSEPIGYWNSLGLLAGMGTLLALGLAARSSTPLRRALAAAPLPLLLTTLYFTFSRGGWAATFAGLLAALLLDRRRLQALSATVLLAPWSALAILLASRSHALTTRGTPLAQQIHQGHRLVLPLLGLCVAAAAASAAVALVEPHVALPTRPIEAGLAAIVVAACLVGFTTYGSPWHLAARAWHGFVSGSPAGGPDLNGRLFHLSGSGRVTQWKVAWRETQAHPVLGSGAGTYERYWNRDRPVGSKVRDVHNLYLEALAELGPLGLALLAATLGLPLAAAARRRAEPLVPLVAGAYVAYLVHAIVDWDWEIASVTLVAVLCAAAVCNRDAPALRLGRRARFAAVAVAGAAGVAGLYGLAMQTTLSRIGGTPAHAAREARHASDLQPWSTEPWRRLAAVDVAAGRFAGARVALRRAVAQDPGDASLWLALAQASDGRERVHAMDRAAALDPKSPALAAFRQTLVSLSGLPAGG